jgi:hypothetical protein
MVRFALGTLLGLAIGLIGVVALENHLSAWPE